jgi:hypothetical protein
MTSQCVKTLGKRLDTLAQHKATGVRGFFIGMVSCSPGQAKIYAPIVIGLGGRWHIQLGDGDFSGVLFGEDPEGFPDDGVILDFLGMSIAEHQQGLGADLGFGRRRWR